MTLPDKNVIVAKKSADPILPSENAFLAASASYVLFIGLAVVLIQIPLPYDRIFFQGVIYLMWSASDSTPRLVRSLDLLIPALCITGLAFSLLGASFSRIVKFPQSVSYLIRLSYRYAVALPLYFLLASNLGRLTANLVYKLTERVHWDFTPLLGRLETPMIQSVQHFLYSPALSWICYYLYSSVWSVLVLLPGPFFIITDQPKPLNKLIAGYFLLSILAVPFFVLLPVFDPWATNPLYANPGAWHSSILYLYPHPNLSVLQLVNSPALKWATGSCFPSLHVAFPLLLFWILRKEGFPRLAATYMILSIAIGFAVVYLGRHWVLDVVAAVPFSYGVARLCEKSKADFVLA